MERGIKTLSLNKPDKTFILRYEVGCEVQALDALVELVNRKDIDFTLSDAANMSHQLGQHLAKELKPYLPKRIFRLRLRKIIGAADSFLENNFSYLN